MKDIQVRADLELLMKSFYDSLLKLEGMQPVFASINFDLHLPKIVDFWEFVVLDVEGYKTNVFDKHLHLPIKSPQFDEWLAVFTSTVDALFAGEKAELIKHRATVLAFTFKSKWQAIKEK